MVIKSGETGTVGKRLRTVNLSDHLAEARAVTAEARRQAERITAEAREHARRAREDAHRSGYEAGYKEGLAEGTTAGKQTAREEATERFQKQHADMVSAIHQAITEIEKRKNDLVIAAEKDLLDLSVLIARKLTFSIGELHRESAQANFRRSLELVGSKTELTIRLNPADRASLEEWALSVIDKADASKWVHIVEDENLAPGGCEVSTDRTRVDATLETQVNDVVAVLLGTSEKDA